MSFRELRELSEALRFLSYPAPVSVDAFRTPNFGEVVALLQWFALRVDAAAALPRDVATEAARVAFLTAAVHFFATRAGVVLRATQLHAADGHAARELLRVARFLTRCVHGAASRTRSGATFVEGAGDDDDGGDSDSGLAAVRPAETAALRAAAGELTARGARLFDLLTHDVDVSRARGAALRFLDSLSSTVVDARAENEHVLRSVRDAIGGAKDAISSLERQTAGLAEDEGGLAGRVRRRDAELVRARRRLESLSTARPAFQEENDRLEAELASEYEAYVLRYRNLHYLQHALDAAAAAERDAAAAGERAVRRLQQRVREEEERALRGDGGPSASAGTGGPGSGAGVSRGGSGGGNGGGGAGGVARGSAASSSSISTAAAPLSPTGDDAPGPGGRGGRSAGGAAPVARPGSSRARAPAGSSVTAAGAAAADPSPAGPQRPGAVRERRAGGPRADAGGSATGSRGGDHHDATAPPARRRERDEFGDIDVDTGPDDF